MTTPSATPEATAGEHPGVAPVVRPPLALLVAYRVLGIRLPAEYHPWVLRDAAAKTFLTWRSLRTFLWGEVLVGLGFLGYYLMLDKWPSRTWQIRSQLFVLAVVLFSSRDALVRRTLRWHRIDKHGRPVAKVKPFARLSNLEAAALGVAVLAATTGVGALVGEAQKPRGILALPCREADPNVLDQITARKTNTTAKYLTTRMIRTGDVTVVIAITDLGVPPSPSPSAQPAPSGSPKITPLPELWILRTDGIFRLGDEPKATTDFPVLAKPDRGLNSAISRAAQCLSEKPVR